MSHLGLEVGRLQNEPKSVSDLYPHTSHLASEWESDSSVVTGFHHRQSEKTVQVSVFNLVMAKEQNGPFRVRKSREPSLREGSVIHKQKLRSCVVTSSGALLRLEKL